MAYQMRNDCHLVALYVLGGADNSLIGLKVHNCTIVEMTFDELLSLVIKIHGEVALNHVVVSLSEHQLIKNDSNLVVLEIVEKADNNGKTIDFYEKYFLQMMRLFKAEDIYTCYFTTYSSEKGNITSQGFVHKLEYKHAITFQPPRYAMDDFEKDCFPKWFDKYVLTCFHTKRNPKFENMLNSYDKSYLIGIPELEFIMLFSVLEMTFGSGRTEITYQISRGTALLLSSSSKEMEEIYRKMKKLYTVRSKYVHNGEKVPIESLYELREIVRKVLIKLVDLGYHTDDKKFDELRKKILLGGYPTFENTEKEI